MVSSAPVASPTPIICTTIDGNTLVSFSGAAIVSPRSMLLRVVKMASSMTALPDVRAVMSSASRIDTPEASRVDSVRQNRATAILRIRLPSTGSFSVTASIALRPPRVP